jgi:hypothetical protein
VKTDTLGSTVQKIWTTAIQTRAKQMAHAMTWWLISAAYALMVTVDPRVNTKSTHVKSLQIRAIESMLSV